MAAEIRVCPGFGRLGSPASFEAHWRVSWVSRKSSIAVSINSVGPNSMRSKKSPGPQQPWRGSSVWSSPVRWCTMWPGTWLAGTSGRRLKCRTEAPSLSLEASYAERRLHERGLDSRLPKQLSTSWTGVTCRFLPDHEGVQAVTAREPAQLLFLTGPPDWLQRELLRMGR